MAMRNIFRGNFMKILMRNKHFRAKRTSEKMLSAVTKGGIRGNVFTRRSNASGCCDHADYHADVKCLMNNQIIAEYNASFAYLSMACYFGRTDVALPGTQGFFLNMHEEEHEHVLQFIKYHTMRGGHVTLCPLHCPKDQDWECISYALCCALELEKMVKSKLLKILEVAQACKDEGVVDWITSNFIQEQDRSICEFGRLVTRAKAVTGDPIGELLFDQMLHKSFVKKAPVNTSTQIIDLQTYK